MSVYDKSEGASLHFDVPSVFCVTACGYFGSGTCLSPKRLVLILEAPCGYFGSALRLSPKRLAVISEAPCGYFALCRGFGGQFIINNDVNVCLIAFV